MLAAWISSAAVYLFSRNDLSTPGCASKKPCTLTSTGGGAACAGGGTIITSAISALSSSRNGQKINVSFQTLGYILSEMILRFHFKPVLIEGYHHLAQPGRSVIHEANTILTPTASPFPVVLRSGEYGPAALPHQFALMSIDKSLDAPRPILS